jgi:hypothetical protein
MVIKRRDNKWYLYSKTTGKLLGGPYRSKKKVLEREKQVQTFKHMKK